MFGQLIISFLIFLKHFFLPPFHSTINRQFFSPAFVFSLHNEKRFFVPDILQIGQVKITFTHGKVINSIQDIGLSNPIISDETIETGSKSQGRLCDIFKVDDI